MKKLITLMTFLLLSPVFAQINNTNTVNGNDINNNSSRISVAPGVSILPPWWAKNLSENNSNQTTNYDKSAQNQTPPKIVDANAQSEVLKKSDEQKITGNPVQTALSPQPNQNVTINSPTAKEIKKPTVIITDISSWNRTTQQEIEDKAKTDLEEKYLKFLMQ